MNCVQPRGHKVVRVMVKADLSLWPQTTINDIYFYLKLNEKFYFCDTENHLKPKLFFFGLRMH